MRAGITSRFTGEDAPAEETLRWIATVRAVEWVAGYLGEALVRYAEHDDDCGNAPCTCGLTEILETTPAYQRFTGEDA